MRFIYFGLVISQSRVNWLSVRSKTFLSLIKSQPKMLYYDGQFDELQLKKERMSYAEIMQAVREEGIGSLDDVAVIVLETDGTLSIIDSPINNTGKQSSLSNLDIKEQE
ncbi:YetF domain-containing protein [Alkalibacterium iburiense]